MDPSPSMHEHVWGRNHLVHYQNEELSITNAWSGSCPCFTCVTVGRSTVENSTPGMAPPFKGGVMMKNSRYHFLSGDLRHGSIISRAESLLCDIVVVLFLRSISPIMLIMPVSRP